MRRTLSLIPTVLAFVTLVNLTVTGPADAAPPEIRVPCDDPIPGNYMVVFQDGSFRTPDLPAAAPRVTELATELAMTHGGRVVHLYQNTNPGYATRAHEAQARRIAADPRVAFLEQSCPVYLSSSSVQTAPPWGLDRVDETDTPLDDRYEYNEDGAGVNIYILDTGVNDPGGSEFGDRLKDGRNFASSDGTSSSDISDDLFGIGHGTAVASIAAGSTYGIAKGANVYPLRVFPHCSNSPCPISGTADVKAGIDWLIANHIKPAVANMSFHLETAVVTDNVEKTEVETAIKNAKAAGIVMIASANNQDDDACTITVSRLSDPDNGSAVISVGAIDQSDSRWEDPNSAEASNFGECVDLWAPGANIPALTQTGEEAPRSGTSHAAPHVTGASALYLQTSTTRDHDDVASYLTGHATQGTLSNLGTGSPNLLLFAKPGHACFS